MIRAATEEDLPDLVRLGARFHAGADLGGVFAPATFWDFCAHLIGSDDGVVFVSEMGMLGGLIGPVPWDTTYKVANEAFWWSEDGQGRALVGAYEEWAKERADEVRMSLLFNKRPLPVARMLGSMGYMAAEESMVKTW